MPYTDITSINTDVAKCLVSAAETIANDAGDVTVADNLLVSGNLEVTGSVTLAANSVTADAVAPSTNRQFLTSVAQTISGAKTFTDTLASATGFKILKDAEVTGVSNEATYGSWSWWNYPTTTTPGYGTGVDSLHNGSHYGCIISGASAGHLVLHVPANDANDSLMIVSNITAELPAYGSTYPINRKLFEVKQNGDLSFGTAGEVAWSQANKRLTLGSTAFLNVASSKLQISGITVTASASQINATARTGVSKNTSSTVISINYAQDGPKYYYHMGSANHTVNFASTVGAGWDTFVFNRSVAPGYTLTVALQSGATTASFQKVGETTSASTFNVALNTGVHIICRELVGSILYFDYYIL